MKLYEFYSTSNKSNKKISPTPIPKADIIVFIETGLKEGYELDLDSWWALQFHCRRCN